MSGAADRLAKALEARQRGDWRATYDGLAALRTTGPLDTESLYALGDAAWWLGKVDETIEIGEECHARFLAEGRPDRAATVALENGLHWMLRGKPEVCSGWIGRARRLLDSLPLGSAHGFLLWWDAQAALAAGDEETAAQHEAQMQQLAVALDDPALGSFALALQGVRAVRRGDVARGLELLDEAMLPVIAGRVPPSEAGNLYCQMISVCTDLADFARARRWTAVTERWCARSSDAVMFDGICRVHRAQLLRIEGDWQAAEEAAAAACAELADLNVEAVAEGRYEIGEARRLRGDVAGAGEAYDAAATLGRVPEPGQSLLLLAQGRVREAAASLHRSLAEESDPFRRVRLLRAEVDVACAADEQQRAEAAASELESLARRFGSPGFRAWALTARAAVLVCFGAPSAAVAPLRLAIAACREMGARVDADAARGLLDRALHAAAGHGSSGAAERSAVPDGLTPREWEVLRAVAAGLSNREVADRLVISEKTVARHLANVFAKLGVSSRTAAAAWAHRAGARP